MSVFIVELNQQICA